MKCETRTVKLSNIGFCIIRSTDENDIKVVSDFMKFCEKDPLTPVKNTETDNAVTKWATQLCKTSKSLKDITVICAFGGKVIALGCAYFDIVGKELFCRMMMFVRKSYRCSGVGSELLKELLFFAEDAASSEIITELSSKDKKSIKFYLNNGFCIDDSRYLNNGKITLIKTLNYSEIGIE